MSTDHLFVYGTLRPGVTRSRHDLLGDASLVGPAEYQGKLYDLGGYPGVVASDDPGDIVHGEVYLLHDREITLDQLDRYEGCGRYAPSMAEYERVVASIRLAHGAVIPAFLYLYLLPCADLERIASGNYLRRR